MSLTPSAVLARGLLTPVDHRLTTVALETMLAVASRIAVGVLSASTTIAAHVVGAGGHSCLAMGASVAVQAPTSKVVDPIKAFATVKAGAGCAILVVCLTVGARKSRGAVTCVRVDVVIASGAVETWL